MTGETIININPETQFELKLQEFDKNIAIAELGVADIKKQKAEFIYNSNVQLIVNLHKAKSIQKQDLSKKIANADINANKPVEVPPVGNPANPNEKGQPQG